MRRPTRGEAVGIGTALSLAIALGGCASSNGARAEASPSASGATAAVTPPETTRPPIDKTKIIGATIINGTDHTGNAVGVMTYAAPNSNRSVGTYPDGDHIEVVCQAPGRTVTDTDVPVGHDPTVSKHWDLLNTPQHDWMGEGYVQANGVVPNCPDDIVKAANGAAPAAS